MLQKDVDITKHYNDAELYLNTYPKLRKWINECVVCHSKGYKPNMPDHIGGEYSVSGTIIRQYFKPLILNDDNICLQCARHIS